MKVKFSNCVAALERAMLLRPYATSANHWELTNAPYKITPEDVFRCVTAEQPTLNQTGTLSSLPSRRTQRMQLDAELLVI